MPLKTPSSVLLAALLGLACTTPTRDKPAEPVASAPSPSSSVLIPGQAGGGSGGSGSGTIPGQVAGAGAGLGAIEDEQQRPTGSAYLGCGRGIPVERLWDETTEGEVLEAITAAKACAAEKGRRLMLEFVAPWCKDCREMAKLDELPAIRELLEQRFERVRVNVGKWDRHEGLRKSFEVHALATYIVIDPKTSKLLARTTLEPITKPGKKLKPEDWATWLRTH